MVAAYRQQVHSGLEQRSGQGYGSDALQSLADFSTAIKQIKADGWQPALCLDEVEERLTELARVPGPESWPEPVDAEADE